MPRLYNFSDGFVCSKFEKLFLFYDISLIISVFFVLQVTSAHGNSHAHHYAENVHEGHFSFETAEGADYHTCFTAADHKPPVKLNIDFEWKSGVAAKDWTNVAKKASVEVSPYFSFDLPSILSRRMLEIDFC